MCVWGGGSEKDLVCACVCMCVCDVINKIKIDRNKNEEVGHCV